MVVGITTASVTINAMKVIIIRFKARTVNIITTAN